MNESTKWRTLPPMNTPRWGLETASVVDKIYVFGGYKSLESGKSLSSGEVYDNISNTWTSLPNMSIKRVACSVVTIGDKIYIIGGYSGRPFQHDDVDEYLSSAEVYDTSSNTWKSLPNMNMTRGLSEAISIGDKIYVIGFRLRWGNFSQKMIINSSCEMFDTALNKWTLLPDMKTEHRNYALCAVDTNIYVIGGFDTDRSVLSSVEVFDTVSQKWSSIPNMSKKRFDATVVAVGNELYVFGGTNGKVTFKSAEVYNIRTRTWRDLPNMKKKRANSQVVLVGDKIYLFGGYEISFALCMGYPKYESSGEMFDISKNVWSSIPNVTTKSQINVLGIGTKIYAIGRTCKDEPLPTLEVLETNNIHTSSSPGQEFTSSTCSSIIS